MGKQTVERKSEIVEAVQELLDRSQMVVVLDYKGLSVPEMNDLRDRLRPTESRCMVVKNTLMRRAISDRDTWSPMSEFLAGPSAFILIEGDVAAAVKAYQAFLKDVKKTEFRGAVMDGTAFDFEQLKAVADLPPKEVLMAQVAGGINALATRIAVGIKEVPTSVLRGINEVPSSLGRAVQAVSDQKKDAA